jgi:hypothetical protein
VTKPPTLFFRARSILSCLVFSLSFSIAKACSGVNSSVIYRKSMTLTSCSGVKSATSFQSGLPSTFAQRSQMALRMALDASCITPRCTRHQLGQPPHRRNQRTSGDMKRVWPPRKLR